MVSFRTFRGRSPSSKKFKETNVRSLLGHSYAILISFKIVVIVNTTSAESKRNSADVILKMITILKEMRIMQLCSKSERTLGKNFIFWSTVFLRSSIVTTYYNFLVTDTPTSFSYGARALTTPTGDGLYVLYAQNIYELSCDSTSCSWTTTALSTKLNRQGDLAFYIPDDLANCS